MKRTIVILTLCFGILVAGCDQARAQTFGSAQWATNGDSYSLAVKGLATPKAIAFYDAGKAKARAWFNYGPVIGTDLTNGEPVGGFGLVGFYEFETRTKLGVTLGISEVWPKQGKGTTVLGIGLGLRI